MNITERAPSTNSNKSAAGAVMFAMLWLPATESTFAAETVATADKSGRIRAIEEVVVTAQKREERLQDVPASVTAVTGEDIQRRGATDIKDLFASVPGLSVANVDRGMANYAIRGVSSTLSTVPISPTVGIMLDDVPVTNQASIFGGSFDAVFFDLDRVEVLKGPQGTLYGSDALGGAIKYISAKPVLDRLSGEVEAGVSTTQHGGESYRAEGVINLPLIREVLAFRGGVSYVHEGGYVDNISDLNYENTAVSTTFPEYTPLVAPSLSTVSRKDYNSADTLIAKGSLLFRPNESFSVRPTVILQDGKIENPSYFFLNYPGQLVSSYRFIEQPTKDRTMFASLDMRKSFGSSVIFTSLTGYSDRRQTYERDYSFYIGGLLPFPGFFEANSFIDQDNQFENVSQEFRLAYAPSDSAFNFQVGLFYGSNDALVDDNIVTPGLGFPENYLINVDRYRDVEQKAIFAEVNYKIIPRLTLTAGGRAFEIDIETKSVSGPGLIIQNVPRATGNESGFSPKFAVSFDWTEKNLVYASAAKGFRPGGSRTAPPAPGEGGLCQAEAERLGVDLLQLESDQLWTYELGSKNTFGDGRGTVNAAIFYTDWNDIQQSLRLSNCGGAILANAGRAEVKGFELDANVSPSSGLQLGAVVSYTDAKATAAEYYLPIEVGDPLPFTPEWTAGANLVYQFPAFGSWDLEIRGDYDYRSKQRREYIFGQTITYPAGSVPPTQTNEDPSPYQESYDVVNASISLFKGGRTIRAFAYNLLNEQPYLDTDLTTFQSRSTTLRPRTIGVELRQRF